jgi:hypothetical protein
MLFVSAFQYHAHFRFRLHCNGDFHWEVYPMTWGQSYVSYGYCGRQVGSPYMRYPIREFLWVAFSYDPARRSIDVYEYTVPEGLRWATTLCTMPPEPYYRSAMRLGYPTENEPIAQWAEAFWFNKRLTPEEFAFIASNYVPPALQYGRFPMTYTDPGNTCPSGGSTTTVVTIPHWYGAGAVTVQVTSDPPGKVSPASFTFDPATPFAARVTSATFTLLCGSGITIYALGLTGPAAGTSFTLNASMWLTADARPMPVPLVSYQFPPVTTPVNALIGVSSGSVRFDGYSNFLDLSSSAADTGLTVGPSGFIIPPTWANTATDPNNWNPTPDGWAISAWFQPRSSAHSHTILSCNTVPASQRQIPRPAFAFTVHAVQDHNYALSFDTYETRADSTYVWWGNRCHMHTPPTLILALHRWNHVAVTFDHSTVSLQLYVNGQKQGVMIYWSVGFALVHSGTHRSERSH